MRKYKGMIVEESLENKEILPSFKTLYMKTEDNWHMRTVFVSEDEIKKLSSELRPTKWYMHFWSENELIVVFKNKIFRFGRTDESGRAEAIKYGLSVGIPREQLDFVIEEEIS